MKLRVLASAIFLAIIGCTVPAAAATISIFVKVTSVEPPPFSPLSPKFASGMTGQIDLGIDQSTADGSANPKLGLYSNAITSLSGSFSNGFTFSATTPGTLTVYDNYFGTNGASLSANLPNTFGVNGYSTTSILFNLFGNPGIVSGDAIPDFPGLLSLTTQADFALGFLNPSIFNFAAVRGTITAITTQTAVTPVPAALPLFISALGGLGFVGWRRRKSVHAAT
jgi:hypothetical protein